MCISSTFAIFVQYGWRSARAEHVTSHPKCRSFSSFTALHCWLMQIISAYFHTSGFSYLFCVGTQLRRNWILNLCFQCCPLIVHRDWTKFVWVCVGDCRLTSPIGLYCCMHCEMPWYTPTHEGKIARTILNGGSIWHETISVQDLLCCQPPLFDKTDDRRNPSGANEDILDLRYRVSIVRISNENMFSWVLRMCIRDAYPA